MPNLAGAKEASRFMKCKQYKSCKIDRYFVYQQFNLDAMISEKTSKYKV